MKPKFNWSMEEKRKLLIEFLDGIRDYELESKTSICYDERESSEFVEIFLSGKEAEL